MDVSYLVLFINFFLNAYVLRGGKAKYRKGDEKNGKVQTNGVTANGKAHASGTANGVCNGSTEHLVKG